MGADILRRAMTVPLRQITPKDRKLYRFVKPLEQRGTAMKMSIHAIK